MKIFENVPKSQWLDEKNIILLHVTFIVTHLMIAAPFLKAQTSMPHLLLRFFSKYFLHRQHNWYVRVAIYTILI